MQFPIRPAILEEATPRQCQEVLAGAREKSIPDLPGDHSGALSPEVEPHDRPVDFHVGLEERGRAPRSPFPCIGVAPRPQRRLGDEMHDRRSRTRCAVRLSLQEASDGTTDCGQGPCDVLKSARLESFANQNPVRMIAILKAPGRILADGLEVGRGIRRIAHVRISRRHREGFQPGDREIILDDRPSGIDEAKALAATLATEQQHCRSPARQSVLSHQLIDRGNSRHARATTFASRRCERLYFPRADVKPTRR